ATAVTVGWVSIATGDEDFPIVGVYAKDQVCKGDGSDPADVMVRISRTMIESSMGICTILNNRRDGRSILVHVECKMAGDLTILGEVTFTQRDEKGTLDYDDQDHTSTGVLYKCAK